MSDMESSPQKRKLKVKFMFLQNVKKFLCLLLSTVRDDTASYVVLSWRLRFTHMFFFPHRSMNKPDYLSIQHKLVSDNIKWVPHKALLTGTAALTVLGQAVHQTD